MKKTIIIIILVLIFTGFSSLYIYRRLNSGKLIITPDPKDSAIYINGQKQDVTEIPFTKILYKGSYSIEVVKEPFQPFKKEIIISQRQDTNIYAYLSPLTEEEQKAVDEYVNKDYQDSLKALKKK